MGYQWHSDLFKSHSYMLFSPYFPIRFKGVFIPYLYIHIPQIFPTGFFEESKLQLYWSQEGFDQGGVLWINTYLFTGEQASPHRVISSTRKDMQLERGVVVNVLALGCHPKGHVLWVVDCSYEQLPLRVNRHLFTMYIFKRSMKATVVPKISVHLHSHSTCYQHCSWTEK